MISKGGYWDGPRYIATLHILGISKKDRQINSIPKIKTAQLISLVVLCYDGCTSKLDKQGISVQKKRTGNNKR